MKKFAIAAIVLASASCAMAKNRPDYQDGKIVQMESVPCSYQRASASPAGEVLGTGSQDKSSQQLLCQEYTVETDLVTYRIRPKDQKHAALVAIGGEAHFRLAKDKLLLETADSSTKEREFVVVSMKPREFVTVRLHGTY
ncbi:MAG: hypothetical protein WA823_16250 [Candidatus Acidiferrales bacterium]